MQAQIYMLQRLQHVLIQALEAADTEAPEATADAPQCHHS